MAESPRTFVRAMHLVEAATKAPSQVRAEYAVRGVAAEMDADELRRVVALLVVQAVWSSRVHRDEARAWAMTVRTRLAQMRRVRKREQPNG